MKRTGLVLAVFISLVISHAALAQEAAKPTIALDVTPEATAQMCPTPVWNGVKAVWSGISDARADKVIGTQTKKGEPPIEVMANPPLDEAFDKALRRLFSVCGMKFVDTAPADTLRLSAQIKEFYSGVEKKLVTGKAVSKGMLTFIADKGPKSMTIDVGTELDSKEIRRGDIKALTKALNQLFVETLKQVPTTQQLRDLK